MFRITGNKRRRGMVKHKYLLLCAFCAVACDCPVEDSRPELISAGYVDSRTITVTLLVRNSAVSYDVNDDTLSVYSTKYDLYYRISSVEKLSGAEYKCALHKEIKPDDRIRVNGHGSLSGSVYFDVSGGEEQP
jgi:hypothetical protein